MTTKPLHPVHHPRSGAPRLVLASLASLLLAVVGLLAGACGTTLEEEILRLSAQESLETGRTYMAEESYNRARPYLEHAFEVEPNSAAGREALLMLADSFYLDGGRTNYTQAEARYRDFLNRFPTSERADYVQFQIANSLAQRMGKPDRDLTATEEALEAYRNLLQLFPTSEYVPQAREKIRLVRANLAAHELEVGDFYLDFRMPRAALTRLDALLEEYPDYPDMATVLYKKGVAHARMLDLEEAESAFARLREEHPDSEWVEEISEVMEEARENLAEAEEQARERALARSDEEGADGEASADGPSPAPDETEEANADEATEATAGPDGDDEPPTP